MGENCKWSSNVVLQQRAAMFEVCSKFPEHINCNVADVHDNCDEEEAGYIIIHRQGTGENKNEPSLDEVWVRWVDQGVFETVEQSTVSNGPIEEVFT
jgi:hypothetical protein